MIRNKLFIFIVCFGVFPAFAATRVQLQSELAALDSEIASLEAEYEKKTSLLQTCEKKSNNLKTAGIVTLAGTGVGVAGNIALHKKYTDGGSGGGGGASGSGLNIKPNPGICEAACASNMSAKIAKYNCNCNS